MSWKAVCFGALLPLFAAGAAGAQTLEPIYGGPHPTTTAADKATIPAAPTNLQAFAVSNTQITLTWTDNSSDETDFSVEARTATTSYSVIGTTPADSTGVNVIGLQPSTTYFFRIRAHNSAGFSAYSNEASATTQSGVGACNASATAMCLNNGRFRVVADFLTPQGQSGNAQMIKLTDDSGYMWFFQASNIEAVVKVLNGCGVNGHYWFFAGGLTNVQVNITVTDTQTGEVRFYTNPQGRAFQPIQDTRAFTTCP